MKLSSPQYRINYRNCQEKGHQDQKLNLICLSKDCIQNSLICSFCIQDKHSSHPHKPLKHFLQILQKQYKNAKPTRVDNELNNLQQQKDHLLANIKVAVEKLAMRFMELEEEVISKYQLMRAEIMQREAKKSRFANFYNDMAHNGHGDPNFQIQNYLQLQNSLAFNLTNGLQGFVERTSQNLEEIKRNLTVKKKSQYPEMQQREQIASKVNVSVESKFIVPNSIKVKGNIFSQTQLHSKKGLCYINTLLKDMKGKIRIKILNLPATSVLTIGVARLQDIKNSSQEYPLKDNSKTLSLNSKGETKGQSYNYITCFKANSEMDVLIKKNHFKVNFTKSQQCDFILYNKEDTVFFWNMEGVAQIQLTYPVQKWLL